MIRFEFANGLNLDFDDSCARVLTDINWKDNTLNPSGMAWRAVKSKLRELENGKPYTEKLRKDAEYVRQLNEVKDSFDHDEVTMEFTVTAELTTKIMKSVNKYDGLEHDYIMYYINGTLVACKRDDGRSFKALRLAIEYNEIILIDRLNNDSEAHRRFNDLKIKLESVFKEFGFLNFYAEIDYQETNEFNNQLVSFSIGEEFKD